MVKTLSYTQVLEASPDKVWEACKHADDILPVQMPEFFTKSELLEGNGGPGTIRLVKMGPAIPHAGFVKERMDIFDDATRTLGYTVLEGDPRYSHFSAKMQFTPGPDGTTEALWTAEYEPVGGMGPPEHVKAIVVHVFKCLETAAKALVLSHTEKLDVSPDSIWKACKQADELLPAQMPQYFTKSELLQGHGGPGSIRLVRMGPAIPYAAVVKERMDLFDDATKTLGYTVLEGDPRYSAFSARMHFAPGPDGSTEATWTAYYVPVGDAGPPEHIKGVVTLMFKALEAAIKANPAAFA